MGTHHQSIKSIGSVMNTTNELLHTNRRFVGHLSHVNGKGVKPKFRPKGPLEMPTEAHLKATDPTSQENTYHPTSTFGETRQEMLLGVARQNAQLLLQCQEEWNGEPPSVWIVAIELSEPSQNWTAWITWSGTPGLIIRPEFDAKIVMPTADEIAWVAATLRMEATEAVG
jgi:hypothetical protein